MSRWRRRRGAEALRGLAAALTLVALADASSARAEETPAGSPAEAAHDLQLEVYINRAATGLIARFRVDESGVAWSPPEELLELGFRREALPAGDMLVRLDRIPGVAYRYDEPAQAIHLDVSPEVLEPTRIDGRPLNDRGEAAPPVFGAAINYNLFASVGGPDGSEHLRFQGVSAALEARVFGRFGVLESAFVATAASGESSDVVRLDTTWTYHDPERLLSYRAGDIVTRGLPWTRPIRMGGLQVGRRFDLRPDLVTTPMPTISGTALAPSTLDLYIDNIRTLTTEVPAGPFQIDRAPLVYGAGMAQVVLRDVTGRELITELPFYAAPELLAPGLADFAIEAGFARRFYGVRSNDYDDQPAISASARYGLRSSLTVEAHAEATEGLANGGVGAAFLIGEYATASGAVAASTADGRTGALFDARLEARHRRFTFSARMQRRIGDYEDLASWTAEPAGFDPLTPFDYSVAEATDQILVSAPLWFEAGHVSLSYTRVRRAQDSIRALGLSASKDFGRATLFASAVYDFDNEDPTSFHVGLSLPLGGRMTGFAGVTGADEGTTAVVEAARQASSEVGDYGWRIRLAEGEIQDRMVSAHYESAYGRLEGALHHTQGSLGAWAQLGGGAAWMDGRPFLGRRLDGPFALVDAGVPGLSVTHENRLVGVTDRRGQLLVPNLTPFQANRIAVDPTNLPLDVELDRSEALVRPMQGGGAVVRLAGQVVTSAAVVTFVGPDGAPLQPGSRGRLAGSGEAFVVGYDGEAFVRELSPENIAEIELADGGACTAAFGFRPEAGRQVRVPASACRPTQLAQGSSAATPDAIEVAEAPAPQPAAPIVMAAAQAAPSAAAVGLRGLRYAD